MQRELTTMQLCAFLGKLPDELIDGKTDGLGEERMDMWLVIHSKRREWMVRHIATAQEHCAGAKDASVYQYLSAEILRQIAMWGSV